MKIKDIIISVLVVALVASVMINIHLKDLTEEYKIQMEKNDDITTAIAVKLMKPHFPED